MKSKVCKYYIESIPNDTFFDRFFSTCKKTINQNSILSERKWRQKNDFISKLKVVEQFLIYRKKFKKISSNTKCIICERRFYKNYVFLYKDIIWNTDLFHYIQLHNYIPSDNFIEIISKKYDKLTSKKNKHSLIFISFNQNKLGILDAVMNHGGYSKRYIDFENKYRYSEHYGVFNIKKLSVDRISIYSDQYTIDQNDPEILYPAENDDILNYDYIFHTHPPTPKPGGRAHDHGIIYEFPTAEDIIHFIYHYNYGKIQGSMIMTPEGLYFIRKYILDNKKIIVDENKLLKIIFDLNVSLNQNALLKYGHNFTSYFFYSRIAQDTSFIDEFNNILKKFKIYIDYFPRIKKNNKWIVDTIYIPYIKKSKKKN